MSTLTERTDAEILDAAADRIERDGWIQGGYFPGWGDLGFPDLPEIATTIKASSLPCCMYGALVAESEGRPDGSERALRSVTGFSAGVFHWNDAPDRTKEEVVAALRAAAAQARGEA